MIVLHTLHGPYVDVAGRLRAGNEGVGFDERVVQALCERRSVAGVEAKHALLQTHFSECAHAWPSTQT